MRNRRFLSFCLAALALAASGCTLGRPATLSYVLTPLAAPEMPLTGQDRLSGLVLVMPVNLPPQLESRSVLREQTGEKLLAAQLWAAPLNEQIGANLAADLRLLLNSPEIALYPGPRFGRARYLIETELSHFSGNAETFTLRAVATISDPAARRILSRKSFEKRAALKENSCDAYAAAASQAVNDWARDIAATLAALEDGPEKTTH